METLETTTTAPVATVALKAKITYNLSEEAQRAGAILTGAPVARRQTQEVAVTKENIGLFSFDENGLPFLNYVGDARHLPALEAADATEGYTKDIRFKFYNPDILGLIAKGKAILAAQEADKIEKRRQSTLAVLAERRTKKVNKIEPYGISWQEIHPDWPYSSDQAVIDSDEAKAWVAELTGSNAAVRAEAFANYQADQDRKAAAVADKEADEKRNEKEKTAFIASWIAQHGFAEIQEQFRDKLLSRREAITLIADASLDPLGQKYGAGDFCNNSGCPCGYETVTTIPTRYYPSYKKLKAKCPPDTLFTFAEIRECLMDAYYDGQPGEDSAGPTKYLVTVKMKVGPFLFEREIEL